MQYSLFSIQLNEHWSFQALKRTQKQPEKYHKMVYSI